MKKIKRILKWYVMPLLILLLGLAVYGHLNPEKVYDLTQQVERYAARLTEHSVTVNGIEWRYLEGGEGEPLLLVHGFGADKDNWTRVARHLMLHYHVIAPDLPGFGESTRRIDLDYSLDGQAKRLHDFAAKLELSEFHLGGSSMGGGIAGVYASLYPNQVKTLWLLAPSNVATPVDSELAQVLKAGEPNPLIADSPETFQTTLDFVFFEKPFIPPAIAKMFAKQAAEAKDLKQIVFHSIVKEKQPIDQRLHGSDIPTLVLWGENDRILDKSGAAVLCESLNRVKCLILSRTGHLPMIEHPKVSAKAYFAFQKHLPVASGDDADESVHGAGGHETGFHEESPHDAVTPEESPEHHDPMPETPESHHAS